MYTVLTTGSSPAGRCGGTWLPSLMFGAVVGELVLASSILAAPFDPRPVARIPSGTIIDGKAPDGWTHLINQSHSRITMGDLDSINNTIAHLASFLSSNLLARVDTHEVSGRRKYRIDEVAVGLGITVEGKEKIITSATLGQEGVRLGLLEKMGLRKAEARLPDLLIIARSDTMIVFDGVSQILRDGEHVEVMARHVVMVDEHTGELNTFIWLIDLDQAGNYQGVFGEIDVLPPNARTELALNVDSDLFVLGLITERALAVADRPPGLYQIEFPDQFRDTAGQAELAPTQLTGMENSLRELLRAAEQQGPEQASP